MAMEQRENRGVIGNILRQPLSFSLTFLFLFCITYGFLAWVDAVPEQAGGVQTPQRAGVLSAASQPELPVRVVAASIGVDAAVVNPNSTDITALDTALESGAVRYPTSARLGADGTALLFGHSTSIQLARSFYKTFNGIQNLKTGAIVSVYSDTAEYRYAVTEVRYADAEEDTVPLRSDGRYLVLVTCNTFATKTDRFVVYAKFVEARALQ